MNVLSDSHTHAAGAVYLLSPYRVSPRLVRAVATVKEAAAVCNTELGFLESTVGAALAAAARELRGADDRVAADAVPLDAFQGGAGTSINMAVNEWIAARASERVGSGATIDPHTDANRHQSTNDVMPTALRLLMHDGLSDLERACEELQGRLQSGETAYEQVLKPGRTQLREAVATTVGREFAAWSHAIGRDRWRCYKARERIREVNLGGTAIGTGAGAPRSYVLGVSRVLQRLVSHPITRAEHLGEATSNYDTIVEAMEAPRSVAVNLRRVAGDIRILASGPRGGIGELNIPAPLEGSSIMAGKRNPVVPEAVIQVAERILTNDALVSRLASMSELELNAFFPAIAHTVDESLQMALGAVRSLAEYLPGVVPDRGRCARNVEVGYSDAVALLPFVGYGDVERLQAAALAEERSIREYLEAHSLLAREDADALFHPRHMVGLGYDEELCAAIDGRSGPALRAHAEGLRAQTKEDR